MFVFAILLKQSTVTAKCKPSIFLSLIDKLILILQFLIFSSVGKSTIK